MPRLLIRLLLLSFLSILICDNAPAASFTDVWSLTSDFCVYATQAAVYVSEVFLIVAVPKSGCFISARAEVPRCRFADNMIL